MFCYSIVYRTIICDIKVGTTEALYMFDQMNVDVMFGPACSIGNYTHFDII
jgi:hypothetical protein